MTYLMYIFFSFFFPKLKNFFFFKQKNKNYQKSEKIYK